LWREENWKFWRKTFGVNPHITLGQNKTWATLVGGELSHHCAILAPPKEKRQGFL